MLTPLDVRKKEFRRCFRGYDEQEVDQFLDHVIDTMEKLIEQNAEMREHLERVEGTVARYKELEDVLKSTMVIAQKTANEIKDNADRQSNSLLEESRAKAHELLREATEKSEEKLRKASAEAEQMLARAREQAEAILTQAREDGTRVLDETAGKVDRMMDEYEALQRQGKIFRAKFRSFLQLQLEMLDSDVGRMDTRKWPVLKGSADDDIDDEWAFPDSTADDPAERETEIAAAADEADDDAADQAETASREEKLA